ncbi:glycosyltransferase (type1) [Thermoproteus tenax Kra 1]|uniref:Glycosyltransferase (Type1) n=1 Tax=Thermoproteus tenax (strain ATCC 35583 / DSM 2078 / JCM 9277 / NBRC 100435 / Kra 1) TaxID=768679 RepID=G4RK90_THETK|nr:glycosyltransferase (type1) [Thermoproteus tenax Kra 1]
MTKLLIIAEQYWPEGGGGTLATHLITKLLAREGFNITVVAGTEYPERVRGVEYMFTPLLKRRDKASLWINSILLSREPWFVKLLRWADVVYIPRYAYPIIPTAKGFGKRVVVHLHDYQPISYTASVLRDGKSLNSPSEVASFELFEHRSLTRALLGTLSAPTWLLARSWVSMADEVICVSKRQAELIVKHVPELSSKISVIYNPLPDIPVIKKEPTEPPSFLYLGGDSFIKGFHIFLKASASLLRRRRAVFLLTKNFSDSSRGVLSKLNAVFDNAYVMLGHLKYEDVLSLHSRAYGMVFPSVWEEPLPYAVVESMLAGTLPIASRVGGVPEIVEGTFAERLLFEPGDVDGLVDRMETVLSMSRKKILDVVAELREIVLKRLGYDMIKNRLLKVFNI